MKQQCKMLAGMLTLGLLVLAPSYAQNNSANRMTPADSTFVNKAAHGGLAEVKLGELAKEKASNPDVKAFGQQMIDDHSKANDELKQVASSKGITLPTNMDAKDQATYDRLSKLSGAEFDKAYMKDMVSDHRTDVNEFRRESEHGADPDVKAFAAKTLPTLEHHLQMAESTDAKVK
jgi:putative membrane protein